MRSEQEGEIKIHTLYDLETQIPTFFHITPAKVHDTKASVSLTDTADQKDLFAKPTAILSMNWAVLQNQLCFNC